MRSCAQAVTEVGGFNVGARVQTKLYIAWGSKRKLKPIRYGAGDRGMDGYTERAAWRSKRIFKMPIHKIYARQDANPQSPLEEGGALSTRPHNLFLRPLTSRTRVARVPRPVVYSDVTFLRERRDARGLVPVPNCTAHYVYYMILNTCCYILQSRSRLLMFLYRGMVVTEDA